MKERRKTRRMHLLWLQNRLLNFCPKCDLTAKCPEKAKIVEGWTVADVLDFFKQLGVIEYTEKAKTLFPKDVK